MFCISVIIFFIFIWFSFIFSNSLFKMSKLDLPGGSGYESTYLCKGNGFDFGLGRFHRLQGSSACVPQPLSLPSRTHMPKACTLQQEKPPKCKALAPQPENVHMQQ